MAQFYKPKANKSKQLSSKLTLDVTQLDHLGAGVAEHNGKVVFIPGALSGETVSAQFVEQKKNFAKAKLLKVMQPSDDRIKPFCRHYQQCGGCDMQHLQHNQQIAHKRTSLVNLIKKLSPIKQVDDAVLVGDITSEPVHYRRRARLATLFNKQANELKLGFRSPGSNKIVAIDECQVLAKPLSELIVPFAKALNQLKAKTSLGHLELTQSEDEVLAVLRVTKSLPNSDKRWLINLAEKLKIRLLLQDDQGELLQLFPVLEHKEQNKDQAVALPYYLLADDRIRCSFTPGNFVQVNAQVNKAMVEQAIDWLAPQAGERILDLFCGVGNFSLPLALKQAEVIGVEGVPEMVEQASTNAKVNGLDNINFYHADLSSDLNEQPWLGKIDKLLLDPARAGAYECLENLEQMQPKSIVYVSCNPASLARDIEVLVKYGYQLTRLANIDMFPQTHHIEAMALFELET
ncbi:23S rRNA (uracil(1939)-C(5))-methyltransferase RlmD [Shewanella sp. WXL01]|uniref:23S rRNA (uracil(1939)-C(5))-methyltransferase RlmD n=1 Tax=Shewanella sp. WXL01 TaxID=2709721 RepID=UPI0014385701|nr:23S rRNA (uracil(1939)-C(5))-methyltransferase RlmD [Shewanella sp. WXL01]NKF49757.1 23S rRNA (uracil(1939)-C(5))-methyltransferase RlmD [Shewanella sp. WXL01]